jgi:transcriptional regulator with XRE-family HTH domain
MTKTKPFSSLAERIKADPVRREGMEEHRRAMSDALALAKLREERGLTQTAVAAGMKVSQRNVSRIEHEEDVYLSTLRGYVAALGGRLEVNAVFPDHVYALVPGDGAGQVEEVEQAIGSPRRKRA